MSGTQRGQTLVIVALGMVVMVAMVGLVIDVGFAWGQQRSSQNGADAAAHAGAIVLLDRVAGGPAPAVGWDTAVHEAVQLSASQNGIEVPEAEYTDWQGNRLGVMVGPSDGLADPPSTAQGVVVIGRITFEPFIAQVIGITTFTANTTATAVAGNITDPCEDGCVLLPITFPATAVTCTDNGQASVPVLDGSGQPEPWPKNTEVKMPMCGGNPGSVGWIDWTPQDITDGCSGTGTAEIICHVNDPPLSDIAQPSWQYITATGGIDALALETALNQYAGQIVLLPLFDSTCRSEPTNPEVSGCPPEDVGGAGANQWYHVPRPGFAAFRLDYPKGAYTNGNNSAICDSGGNGATDCLIGVFVDYVTTGTVGPPDPDNPNYGVQLIE